MFWTAAALCRFRILSLRWKSGRGLPQSKTLARSSASPGLSSGSRIIETALELFPQMRESLLRADDYHAVWRDIHREFRAALASGRDEFAKPFFTLGPSPQTRTMPQVSQAAAETFYEFADDLHRWIDRYDFMHAQKGLRYYLGESRYSEFEHRFLEHTDGYIKKRSA